MGPVLKEALLGWLCEPPLDRLVMAFASAVPEDGGTGATYVLLRRKRTRSSEQPACRLRARKAGVGHLC